MPREIKLTESGSITLPAALRREMNLDAGQRFTAVAKGNTIVLVPVVNVRTLRGSAKGADTTGFRD